MMTFLPFEDFIKTAQCLDNKRLGKQRLETLQILNSLNSEQGWYHYPITKMWKGYELCLIDYGRIICREWASRGYIENTEMRIISHVANFGTQFVKPPWLGDERLHLSHRSNLIRKKPDWYRDRLGWRDPDNLSYYYPR